MSDDKKLLSAEEIIQSEEMHKRHREFVPEPHPPYLSKEWAEAECDKYNAREGDLKGYDCGICRNKGYVLVPIQSELDDSWVTAIRKCECQTHRNAIKNISDSGLDDYIGKTLDDYSIDKVWQEDIRDQAQDYIDRGGDNWWCICGQSGSGKTLITSIIANELMTEHNRKVVRVTWTDWIGKLKRDMRKDDTSECDKAIEEIKTVDVLFLDELIKQYNETDIKYLVEIINYRYNRRLKTLITSEKLMSELIKIDEATFGRVVEMAGEFVTNIPKDQSKNYRFRKVGGKKNARNNEQD